MITNKDEQDESSKSDSSDKAQSFDETSEKTLSLKNISELLARRKLGGQMYLSKDQNIFPLWPTNKHKFLDAKDYVEIAIRYCIMDDQEILEFIMFLYDDQYSDIKICNLFPVSVYKLMIYYEKMNIFETLYDMEKRYDKIKGSTIINDWFSYCIMIDNITLAIYLLK